MKDSLATTAPEHADRVETKPENGLLVLSGEHFIRPAENSELLLGFNFAVGSAIPVDAGPVGVVNLALEPLSPHSSTEAWWYKGAVSHSCAGSVRLAECADFSLLIIELDETRAEDLKHLAAEAYQQLFETLKTARHKNPVRIWNHFDRINEQQNGEERYRLFSSGRAEAFARFGIADIATPVGTAIGTHGSGKLVIVMLASEMAYEVIENPRQISAYRYPEAYGKDSPKFSRSGLLGQASEPMLLISGTAAVVGHESAFPFDTARQFDETLVNLDVLFQTAQPEFTPKQAFRPGAGSALRIYLRNAADLELVQARILQAWGELPKHLLVLRGDICRSELMIEIEAVLSLS